MLKAQWFHKVSHEIVATITTALRRAPARCALITASCLVSNQTRVKSRRLWTCCLIFHLQKQDRDIDRVANLIRRRTIEQITDKPMAVCRHGNEINLFLPRQFNDLV